MRETWESQLVRGLSVSPPMDEALLETELGEQAAEGPGVPVTSKCD